MCPRRKGLTMTKTMVAYPERRMPPKERMTFEEYLEWCDEDTWAEWVGGEVRFLPQVTSQHQEILGFLMVLRNGYIESKNLGKMLTLGYLMYLPDIPSARFPDILFARRKHADRFQEYFFNGAADLVIEIVSPESSARDRGEKFVEYEKAGVREYWLIDPIRRIAEFNVLNSAGVYQSVKPDARGIYRSQVVDGFWLHVEWLWQDPLPMEEDVLKAIRGGA
jgi:Uma2 family endonuclease